MKKTTTITATQMQKKTATIIRQCYVNREHFIATRDGFPVIAIIPVDEYRQLMKARSEDKA